MDEKLKQDTVKLKDVYPRKFKVFTNNFYLVKSAVRYYTVKKNMSFTANKISENFPLSIPAAGSSLSILNELDIVKVRTESSSPNRYLPKEVDMNRLEKVEKLLRENYEIDDFKGQDP